MNKYEQWIANYVEQYDHQVTAMCAGATLDMVAAFPELRRVRGYYSTSVYHRAAHWWCETTDGIVYDPTVSQFDHAHGTYEEYTGPDPIGKCYNCGSYVWDKVVGVDTSSFCSLECQDALVLDMNLEIASFRRGY